MNWECFISEVKTFIIGVLLGALIGSAIINLVWIYRIEVAVRGIGTNEQIYAKPVTVKGSH